MSRFTEPHYQTYEFAKPMRAGGLFPPMGSGGKTVEIGETFYGFEGQPKTGKRAWSNENVVLTLVERGDSARSFHVDGVRAGDLLPIKENLSREAEVMTDEMYTHKYIASNTDAFASHDTVNHSKDEYRPRRGPLIEMRGLSAATVAGRLPAAGAHCRDPRRSIQPRPDVDATD